MTIKPQRLRRGDTVAVLSPSWGGPARFPATFEAGLATLESLGLLAREYPTTRSPSASADERVRDVHAVFADSEVHAVVTSIGGDDSVRLLPKLDSQLIAANPKILLGYSDTSTLLTYLRSLNQVAFHGPSVMAGLAQAKAYPSEFIEQFKALLFDAAETYEYPNFGVWCDGYEDWSKPENASRPKALAPDLGARSIQDGGIRSGTLWGGCLEVLEMLKGTSWWPAPSAWAGTVVIIEGSEESPAPEMYARVLRSWAAAGNLEHVAALLVGRPARYSEARRRELDDVIRTSISVEAQRPDMTILTNCSFGHTDPQWLLPLGCRVSVDPRRARVTLIESAVL